LPNLFQKILKRNWLKILNLYWIIDWRTYNGNLGELTIDDVVEGAKVVIEYTPVPFTGKKPKGNDEGFSGGCTLKLHSITVLGINEQHPILDMSSPSKRRRLNYV
jgi:hypothetical protein